MKCYVDRVFAHPFYLEITSAPFDDQGGIPLIGWHLFSCRQKYKMLLIVLPTNTRRVYEAMLIDLFCIFKNEREREKKYCYMDKDKEVYEIKYK